MTSLLLFVAYGWSGPASAAERCASIDKDRDTLSEGEQRSALLLLEDALSAAKESTAAPCGSTWTVSHVKIGEAVTVALAQGNKRQSLQVSGLEELPVAYERLIRALQTGQPVAATADRNSVTAAEANAKRVQADPLVYVQLGGGATGFDPVQPGVAFGLGYRHALDSLAIDISGFNFVMPGDLENSQQFSMTLVELGVLYYFDGAAASSPYAGAALGYSFSSGNVGSLEEETPVRGGAQGTVTVGYELLRQSSIRLFPQLDLGVPFYRVRDYRVVSGTLTLNLAFRPVQSSGIQIF